MRQKVDVIVVGAGPAGLTAAYIAARAGLEVAVLERGGYPGSKNMMGGILFTTILGKIIPDFWKYAPLERRVTTRKFSLLSSETEVSFKFNTHRYSRPPFNNTFTALRAKYDRWFAAKTEELGAMILPGVLVDELIFENKKCVGVRTRLTEGDLFADCVILAEGANGILAEKAGLKTKAKPQHMAVGVKEILDLPRGVIEDRFSLEGGEGVAIEYFGAASKGMFGGGFLYTNRESISLGVAASIGDASAMKIKCDELLEYFKGHPCVRKLIRGCESREYSAHMLPEFGYDGIPELVRDGLIVVGDCAGFLNVSPFHEGTNLAMASGMMAGEAVIKAKEKNDFAARTLSAYKKDLKNSFVLKDMKKFRKFPQIFRQHPEFLSRYSHVFADMVTEYFTISEKPKKDIEKEIFRKFRKEIGIMESSRVLFSLIKGMGWM